MRTVSIDRHEFIERVTENRSVHRQAFEAALDGYQARLTRELERRVADVRAGRRIDHYIQLPEPQDHTNDYDRILTMAKMSVDDVIELDADDFACFVMDQWHWKQGFDETATYYEARRVHRS